MSNLKKFILEEMKNIETNGFNILDNNQKMDWFWEKALDINEATDNLDCLYGISFPESSLLYPRYLELVESYLRHHGVLASARAIQYFGVKRFIKGPVCSSIQYLCPTFPWLSSIQKHPINCALGVVVESTKDIQIERIVNFAKEGTGVGITLLINNVENFLITLNTELSLITKSTRDRRVSVFIPSFLGELTNVLSKLNNKSMVLSHIGIGVILFTCLDDRSKTPFVKEKIDEKTFISYYNGTIPIPDNEVYSNFIEQLFVIKKRNILYILDGYSLQKGFSKLDVDIQRRYPEKIMGANLCNEVVLPLNVYEGKFQLCILMGLNYYKMKMDNLDEIQDDCIILVLGLLKSFWQYIESLDSYNHIDTFMHPIGLYFNGVFNFDNITYSDFVELYKNLIRKVERIDSEGFFKTYTTLPPGSNVEQTWGISPPFIVHPNGATAFIGSSRTIQIKNMLPQFDNINIRELLNFHKDLDSCRHMGSSIETKSEADIDETIKIFKSPDFYNYNVNYYTTFINSDPSSTQTREECKSCIA